MDSVYDRPTTYQQAGWIILIVLSVLSILNSIAFGMVGVTPDSFKVDTGLTWSEFSAAYPTVANKLDLAERLNGTGFSGGSVFALLVALLGVRRGMRWAWYVLWTFPVMILLAAVWFFSHQRADIGLFYAGMALAALVGLLLSYRATTTR